LRINLPSPGSSPPPGRYTSNVATRVLPPSATWKNGCDPFTVHLAAVCRRGRAAGHKPMSPLKALRLRCLDCCAGSPHEVRMCQAVDCPSWPFRGGDNPWRKSAERAEAHKGQGTANARGRSIQNPNGRYVNLLNRRSGQRDWRKFKLAAKAGGSFRWKGDCRIFNFFQSKPACPPLATPSAPRVLPA
jgi:hypothetical protein